MSEEEEHLRQAVSETYERTRETIAALLNLRETVATALSAIDELLAAAKMDDLGYLVTTMSALRHELCEAATLVGTAGIADVKVN